MACPCRNPREPAGPCRWGAVSAGLVLLTAGAARGDVGGVSGPGGWLDAWNWDPVVLLNLGLLWWLYGRGLGRVWSQAGTRGGVGGGQPAAFLGALAVLLITLVSPLDAVSGELASAHMVQHMLLVMAAAPLFVLGAPAQVLTWGLPLPWRRTIGRWRRWIGTAAALRHPLLPWTLFALALWAWHIPALYGAALRHPVLHDLQHLTFFGAACLFWQVLLDPIRQRLHPAAAVVYLFMTSLQASALGVLLTFAPRSWYGEYAGTTAAWGLTPLEDQQLAGLIMWMPACLVYAVLAVTLLAVWLNHEAGLERPLTRKIPVP